MREFLIRLVINAIALAVAAAVVPGITIADNGAVTLLIVALIFGLLNAILKPVLLILSCPLILLTLGLFLLVVNGLLLLITDRLAGGRLEVDGLWAAILGSIVISILSMILESVFGLDDEHKKGKKDKDDVIIFRS